MTARTKFSLPSRIPPPRLIKPPKFTPSWSVLDKVKEPTSIPQDTTDKPFIVFPETQPTQEKLSDIPQETPPEQPVFSRYTHVALPNIYEADNYLRWDVIKYQIHEMKTEVRDGGDIGDAIKNCILAYNPELICTFGVLYDMIYEAVDLFGDGKVRKVAEFIGDACLGVDGITNGVKLLKGVRCGGVERVELGRLEIVTLLACGFMCTYPGRDGKCEAYRDYPQINFDGLYDDKYRNAWGWGVPICCKKSKVHRLLCIFNYFRRMYERVVCSGELDNSKVVFERRTLSAHETPKWDGRMTERFCDLEICEDGVLEESIGCIQIDFANKFVGGSTLGHGIRMEEIMFSQSPELMVTQLFTKVLRDNECVVVDGVERFSYTTGYGVSFRFVGEYFDEWGSRVGVMDAVKFERSLLGVQVEKEHLERELNKCYVTFKGEVFVASGKWGAGVFNGDPLLKCMLQWIGASVAGVKGLDLYTFGDKELSDQLNKIAKFVGQRGCSVGEIYSLLMRFGEDLSGRKGVTTNELFKYICTQIGTEVTELGVDRTEEYDPGISAKWYVVELIWRLALAWKELRGVVTVGAILGWVVQEWVTWGRNVMK